MIKRIKNLNFGIKIMLQIIALISIIFLLITSISYYKMKNSLTDTIKETLQSRAADSSAAIEKEFDTKKEELYYISKLPEIQTMNWDTQKSVLLNEIKQWGFEAAYIIDLNGFTHYSNDTTADMSNDSYFEEIKERQSYITNPWIDPKTNQAISTIIIPIKNDSNDILGYMCGTIDLANINNIVQNVKIGENGYSFLMDKNGEFISHKNMELVTSKSNIKDLEKNYSCDNDKIETLISNVLNKKNGTDNLKLDNENSYIAYSPVNSADWSIVLVASESEILSNVYSLRNYQIILFSLTIFLSIIISLLIQKQISKQLNILKNYSDELSKCNLSYTTTTKRNDEFGKVINSLNSSVNILNDSISNVRKTSNEIFSSNSEIDNMISNISSQLEKTASATEEISASMEECSATIDIIKSMTEKVNNTTEEFSTTASNGLKLSNKIQEESERIYEKAVNTKNDVEETYSKCKENLKEAIDKTAIVNNISTLSDSILAIAEETNLLSLNASIEAARAGESGKGFAVVANEVKSLADQSSKTVSNIQDGIKQIIEAVTSLSTASKELLDLVENNILNDYNNLINISLSYQAAGTTVNDMTKNFFNISDKISNSIDEIVSNTKDLSESLSSVSESSQLIAENAANINNENSKIVSKADENKTKASNLTKLVGKFVLR